MEITNKELRETLERYDVTVECGCSFLTIDIDRLYLEASLYNVERDFKVSAYLGDEVLKFTDSQLGLICNKLAFTVHDTFDDDLQTELRN